MDQTAYRKCILNVNVMPQRRRSWLVQKLRHVHQTKRGPWNVRDELTLLRRRRQGLDWCQIARELNRTEHAVAGRYRRLNDLASNLRWTYDQDLKMLALHGKSRTWDEIGQHLGKKADHCQYRYVLNYECLALAPAFFSKLRRQD